MQSSLRAILLSFKYETVPSIAWILTLSQIGTTLHIVIIYCWFSDALNLNWIKLLTIFALKFSRIRRETTLWRSVGIIYVKSHFHSSLLWFRLLLAESSKSLQLHTRRSLKMFLCLCWNLLNSDPRSEDSSIFVRSFASNFWMPLRIQSSSIYVS